MRTGDAVKRRDFLRRAAVVGTGAFVVPTIITVDPANAQAVTSPPPEPPGGSEGGSQVVPSGNAAQPGNPAGNQGPGGGELALTGMDLGELTVAGLAATAGGAALMLWSAEARSRAADASAAETADPAT